MSGLLGFLQAAVLLGGVATWIGLTFISERPARTKAGAALAFGWLLMSGLMAIRASKLFPAIDNLGEAYASAHTVMAVVSAGIVAGPLIVLLAPPANLARRTIASAVFAGLIIGSYFGSASSPDLARLQFAAAALTAATIPTHALATWTERDIHVGARSALQTVLWLAILLWLLPDLAMQQLGGKWHWPAASLPHLGCAVVFIIALAMIVAALWQFAREGRGTGLPWDPPRKLVVGGIYAHVRNPMQLGICLMIASWGALLGLPLVIVSAAMALVLFIVFRDVCAGVSNVAVAQSLEWQRYKANVPAWYLRREPWRAPGAD